MKCKTCSREAYKGAYCPRHGAAYTNLEEGYEKWRYALGLTWVQYLERLTKIAGTGKLVKEIIADILG
jgi:hypothetical protein